MDIRLGRGEEMEEQMTDGRNTDKNTEEELEVRDL